MLPVSSNSLNKVRKEKDKKTNKKNPKPNIKPRNLTLVGKMAV